MGCDKCSAPHDKPCPRASLRQVALEALLIVGSYAVLAFMLEDGTSFSLDGIATFLAIFIPISFVLRCADVDYKDQLARVALFQLGVKIFNTLA